MKKIVCALLAAVMILTLVLSAVVTVSAADVPEIDFDELLGKVPGKPVLTAAEKTTVGTPVSFTWENVENATTYTVIIEQKDGEEWKEVEKFAEAASPLSVELPEGSYRACVLAINGNNNGIYTASDDVEFAVTAAYIVGDMNNDGQVTDADAIYLLRFTLFPDNYAISQPADFTNDGSVTDADAIYLLRYTLFPENYPLSK